MVSAVILAAGKGTRMKSSIPKVLHPFGSRTLIEVSIEKTKKIAKNIIVVLGYKGETVELFIRKLYPESEVKIAWQKMQLGTADALKSALPLIDDNITLVLPADMPLISVESLKKLTEEINHEDTACVVLSCQKENPTGYGRLITDGKKVLKIVEEVEADEDTKKIKLVNTGVYCFKTEALKKYINLIKNDNPKGEFFLTDIVEIMNSAKETVLHIVAKEHEGFGINTKSQLAEAYQLSSKVKVSELIENGVTILAPDLVFIEDDVSIQPDTVVFPFVNILKGTHIGERTVIKSFVTIESSIIGDRVIVNENTKIEGAFIEDEVSVGPFARIREKTVLRRKSKIGNFVEVKKSTIGEETKANHLAYIGDATVGREVNIGAGTITCNYDGIRKHPTIIEDKVFIGSDTQLVAPVKIGKGSLIGAGSTITKDIPPDSLALTRADLKIFEGKGVEYFKRKKSKKE